MSDWRAKRTRSAYAKAWKSFVTHLGVEPVLPVPPELVSGYLSSLGDRASHSTVRLHAAAIAATHRGQGFDSPCEDEAVKATIKTHARTNALPPQQAAPLDAKAFEAISETAMIPRTTRGGRTETQVEANFRALVDCGLIGLMRDAMLRRSEAAALTWGDLEIQEDRTGRLLVRRSKTDQEAHGAVQFVGAEVCDCLHALRLMTGGHDETSMFNLSASQICRRIASAAEHAGLTGRFSGHSPRIGMAQDLANHGATMVELMNAGRWKSDRMPAHYTRNQVAARGAVAKYYGTVH